MKKKILYVFAVMLGISCSDIKKESDSRNDDTPDNGNEPRAEQILLADPTIFYHDNNYYLYGTSQGDLAEKGLGFLVFTSDDMENWEGPKGAKDGFALKEGDAFGTQGFWAPQVFEHKDEFYMAYTANERIAIATSDSPLGPFTNSGEALPAETKQIDPFVFFDDEIAYLYHVRLDEGNRIYVAEMNENLTAIKPETLKESISSQEQWENTENVEWPVAEGPTVIKSEGIYYLLYSVNDFRNPDYAVGYATSSNPLGPWEKSQDNPIIDKGHVKESGPGHGDLVLGENREMHYVLHTHFSDDSVHPRKTAVVKMNFAQNDEGNEIIRAEEDSFTFLKSKEE